MKMKIARCFLQGCKSDSIFVNKRNGNLISYNLYSKLAKRRVVRINKSL